MEILTYPNEMLTTHCRLFDFDNPPFDPHQVSKEMIDLCNQKRGVSLSANQVGIPYRLFIMLGSDTYACFNPKIINSKDEILLEETCLSYPGLSVKVKRFGEVRLRFQTPSGGTDTRTFHGVSARIIQHEIDHLDGIPFYTRANRYHRELAFNKRDKLLKQTRKEHEEINRIAATGFSGVVF